MITMTQPLRAGNAIRLFLTPPDGARYWRVLKMGSDSFTGPDDLDFAVVAYEGDERTFVDADAASLPNDQMVFYRPYYRMADDTWQAGATANATPSAAYEDATTDVLAFVRERLEAGLLVEVQRGNFQPELGYIPVYTAPPSLEQGIRFPVFTLSLENENPIERAIGEDLAGDEFDPAVEDWFESEGWLAEVRLSIIGWALNSDERIELRRALRRIIIANIPTFSGKGFEQVELSMQDMDAVDGEYNCNLYQVMATMKCIAPARVGSIGDAMIITETDIRSNP